MNYIYESSDKSKYFLEGIKRPDLYIVDPLWTTAVNDYPGLQSLRE